MINLNDDSFTPKTSDVAIFNDGTAGIVENVKVSVVKKTAEDKENAPDYKLVYTDSKGATTNNAYWYINGDTQYATVAEQINKLGKVLRHLLHAVYGSDYQLPEFPNEKAMLDTSMKLLKDGLAKAGTFRVFANYGTIDYPKSYIQVRTWVPFIENSAVFLEDTRLKASQIEQMSRVKADSPFVEETAGATADDGDDW